MTYDPSFFDAYLERRNTRSSKWDGCNAKFGVDPSVEMLPMWIADMDFRSPTEVVEALTLGTFLGMNKKAREALHPVIYTFIMLVYAEMYGAQYGMGYYVKKFSDFGLYNKVWVGFIFMVIVMVIVMQLFEHLKNRLLKWTIH